MTKLINISLACNDSDIIYTSRHLRYVYTKKD